MNLEQFAIKAGVEIFDCGGGCGGRIGYKEKDHPNCSVCGFRTKDAAYKEWLATTFGKTVSREIAKLIKSSNVKLTGSL